MNEPYPNLHNEINLARTVILKLNTTGKLRDYLNKFIKFFSVNKRSVKSFRCSVSEI